MLLEVFGTIPGVWEGFQCSQIPEGKEELSKIIDFYEALFSVY